MPAKLKRYTPEEIHLVWDEVKHPIQRALDHGHTHTLGDVLEGLITGEMTLWTWGEAALVAEIIDDFCQILTLAGGKLADYFEHLETIEAWAAQQGCNEMRVYGRRGWVKILKDYDEQYTVLSKKLRGKT